MDTNTIPNKNFDWTQPSQLVDIPNSQKRSSEIRRKDKNLDSKSAEEVVSKIHNYG